MDRLLPLRGHELQRYVLGDPPEGCSLEIVMSDHDLGGYPGIGVRWLFPTPEPSEYIARAQVLLYQFNHSVEWEEIQTLPEHADKEVDDEQ